MRSRLLLAALTMVTAAATAEARLFWQTFGSVVPAEGSCGAGCAWNLNQDYFVPRHCDTGRYALFSPCKTAHTRSAACRNLHPIYHGYCSPYGACRYRWRDHVYKTFCGCEPLKHSLGPWRVDHCRKHVMVMRLPGDGCLGGLCSGGNWQQGGEFMALDPALVALMPAPHVEPFGGEILGTVAALPSGSLGGSLSGAVQPRASTGVVSVPAGGSLPGIPKIPAPSSGTLPAPLDY